MISRRSGFLCAEDRTSPQNGYTADDKSAVFSTRNLTLKLMGKRRFSFVRNIIIYYCVLVLGVYYYYSGKKRPRNSLRQTREIYDDTVITVARQRKAIIYSICWFFFFLLEISLFVWKYRCMEKKPILHFKITLYQVSISICYPGHTCLIFEM